MAPQAEIVVSVSWRQIYAISAWNTVYCCHSEGVGVGVREKWALQAPRAQHGNCFAKCNSIHRTHAIVLGFVLCTHRLVRGINKQNGVYRARAVPRREKWCVPFRCCSMLIFCNTVRRSVCQYSKWETCSVFAGFHARIHRSTIHMRHACILQTPCSPFVRMFCVSIL